MLPERRPFVDTKVGDSNPRSTKLWENPDSAKLKRAAVKMTEINFITKNLTTAKTKEQVV